MTIKTKFATQVGVGNSDAIDIHDTNDIRISYAVSVTGTVNYTVQHSLDATTFFDNTDVLAQTANKDGNYIFPVRSVRVKVNSGSGTAVIHVRQLVV